MPRIDVSRVALRQGCPYPPPFDAPCATRTRRPIGDAGGGFVHKDGTPYPQAGRN